MEDNWLWYLVGVYDTAASFTVSITKQDDMAIGYDLHPEIHLSRPENKKIVFGMANEYCEENGVGYRMDQRPNSIEKLVIQGEYNIKDFLTPIIDGFVQQREQAEIMLDEIVPIFIEEKNFTKEGVIELMDSVDVLREKQPSRREVKYTKQYFKKEWNIS